MTEHSDTSIKSYGMLEKHAAGSELDQACEELENLGYTVIPGAYTPEQVGLIAEAFDQLSSDYQARWGLDYLSSLDEQYTVRLPLSSGNREIARLAFNPGVLELAARLIKGRFQLNQQNFIINPAGKSYNQDAWHRDLPYQHFVSSHPLAINALYCVDDFSAQNGATFVIPASHKIEAFPSERYIEKHQFQVEAKAGDFIVLDCMTFHRGAFNNGEKNRRAVNHVYSIPFIKQQINIPENIDQSNFTPEQLEVLGLNYTVPGSVADYLKGRAG